jgi:type IV secretory pathway component VirB8
VLSPESVEDESPTVDCGSSTKLMETYMSDANLPDVELEIKNVVLEEIQNPPYKAKVDMNKLFVSRTDRSVLKQELSTISFVYSFKERVENQLIPINPLGLTITYFREDQAFK